MGTPWARPCIHDLSPADRALALTHDWLASGLRCYIGRVHYRRSRFLVMSATTAGDLETVRRHFGTRLEQGEALSCTVVIRPHDVDTLSRLSIADLVTQLEDMLFPDVDGPGVRDVEDAAARSFSMTYRAVCPVIGAPVDFTDFDQVLFYPQAVDIGDPLYDPSMFAPAVCLNITSDAYGFAVTVADERDRIIGDRTPMAELRPAARREVYRHALPRFQRLAVRTIAAYGRATDPLVATPIAVSADGHYYVARHDEAAFAETRKCAFVNEMPTVYLPRLIDQWERYFATGQAPDISAVYVPARPLGPLAAVTP